VLLKKEAFRTLLRSPPLRLEMSECPVSARWELCRCLRACRNP